MEYYPAKIVPVRDSEDMVIHGTIQTAHWICKIGHVENA